MMYQQTSGSSDPNNPETGWLTALLIALLYARTPEGLILTLILVIAVGILASPIIFTFWLAKVVWSFLHK
jgi:hypothetical protein